MKSKLLTKGLYSVLFLWMLSIPLTYGQGVPSVKGVVYDETGATLPGAQVMIKGTDKGVVTDFDGNFKFVNVRPTDVLMISYIGYETTFIKIGTQTEVKVALTLDTEVLDEIVVVGYGVQDKRDVSGSIASVDSETFENNAAANFDEMLSGQVAGMSASTGEGTPGAAANIVIRGGNSITGDNSPLYVVDGFPMEDFDPSSISPSDIKGFEVLKDASATAIYGSRGANGVIIITTKGGKAGKFKVGLTHSTGVALEPNGLALMSPYEFVKMQEEIAISKGGDFSEQFYNTWVDPELYKDMEAIDWQDRIMQDALFTKTGVTFSGGNEQTKHYTSLNYMNQDGVLLSTGYENISARMKIDHKLHNNGKIGINLNYTHSEREGLNNNKKALQDAWRLRPVDPINPDGRENGIDENNVNDNRYDPVATLNNTENNLNRNELRAIGYYEQPINKHLKFRIAGSAKTLNETQTMFFDENTYSGSRTSKGVNGSILNNESTTLKNTNTVTYNNKWGKHKLQMVGGAEFSHYQRAYVKTVAEQMMPGTGIEDIRPGTSKTSYSDSYYEEDGLASYFARATYSFKGKYILTGTYRMDGSSKFRGDNKYGHFPSLGAAWRMGDEPWMKSQNIFSDFKFRGGYGVTGNNRIHDYAAYSQMSVENNSGYILEGEYYPGVVYNELASQDLKWETTFQSNFGVDMGFLNDKLNVTVDLYQKRTKDLLLNAEVPESSGFSTVFINVGEVQNRGVEFTISNVNIDRNDFKWTSSLNLSHNKNEVLALNNGQDYILSTPGPWSTSSPIDEYMFITQVGQPVGQFYGLQYEGLYSNDDFYYIDGKYELKPGIPNNGNEVIPGSPKYKDVNGDGTIDERDRTVVGDATPLFFGGFTNTVKYKNFDLAFTFTFSYGGELINANRIENESPDVNLNINYFEAVDNRYTKENPNGDVHIIRGDIQGENQVVGRPPNGNQFSSQYVEDGSYLKLKNITLGYTFDKRIAKKISAESIRIYASAQDVWTLTNYSGFDPEVSVGGYGAMTPGYDYLAYPRAATYVVGFNINF
ncbi:SusC/RagA family TonB-linked outer membrane protein [Flammeovirga kamogawensis]|uniref:TonB-dependent receptor n=1 Tax=Flammeovirga kamogawensis TaxID=373891 RepID=A0ABX8H3N7_9BACT|nr:TonB-dependent receptor [Flammeovirga kamogawensis]MBB6461877.1 TonB-linked SusC/RagA family outer membrane protein [Flammeovirga kamogawensis]QWG10509.1 TonB-dependent receptor [Flammeovirga kamogawensis]TRX63618.1 TonB-dependent receptor [Flammeovirga kamogawensis]